MVAIRGTSCCGVKDVLGIQQDYQTPEIILTEIAKGYRLGGVTKGAHYMFTGAGVYGRKKIAKIEKFIKDMNLGTTTKSAVVRNPNTQRGITVLIFSVNKKTLEAFKNDI